MRAIDLDDYENAIEARKAILGFRGTDFIARNDGTRRTAGKREMLRRLADMAQAEGREPRFRANF